MADVPGGLDYPEDFERWPPQIQAEWLEQVHALYFPKLRWWEKPETLEEDSGPRGKQYPPDHPRHVQIDLQGFHCGCPVRHPEEDRGKVLTCGCGGNPDYWVHLVLTGRGFGKALDLGTMIPVPSGWKELGDIAIGDEVFDETGRVCRVTATFDVTPGEAYRLTFSDGTTLDACADHQWVTWTHAERKAFLRSPYEDTSRFPENWPAWRLKRAKGRSAPRVYYDSPGPQIRTTAEVVKTLTIGARGDTNHCVPVCGALDLPEASLPVDPYVLGAWLGDGNSADARVTIGDEDAEDMLALLAAAGAPLAGIITRPEGTASATYPIGCRAMARDPFTGRMTSNDSLHSQLRLLGVLRNKHVPAVYLRASASQRLALLQGLMDTDGGWTSAGSGMVEFGSSSPRLAQAVMELARSLGQKPVSAESRAVLKGKDCGPRWRVTWTPTVQVFRLPRKAGQFAPGIAQGLRKHHRMIVSAELIDPQPMRCLTVDSPHSMYLAGEGMIPTHNTKQGSNWSLEMGLSKSGIHVGVCAPTYEAVRSICFEGEALALDTYVPTPSGHTTMGEVKPGDIVLGGDGSPCRVTAAYAPMTGRDCYRVTFKGGAEVIADGEHKWLVSTYLDRVARRRGKPRELRVMTTAEMIGSVRYEKMRGVARNYGVGVAKASYSDEFSPLMIDPYVLGYWLGDGTAKSADITTMDPEVLTQITAAGYDIVQRPDDGNCGQARTYGIYKLWRHLRLAGLLRNKHVPDAYLRASAAERLALVQGLMDSDGYVSERGQCEFVNKNKDLADALVDLLCGLGVKASAPHPKTSKVGTTHWLVKFTTTLPVFRIPRKLARIPATYRDADDWVIWSVEPVPPVPVRCISVDSPDRTYLVTRHHIATHNSGIIAEARRNDIGIVDYNKNRLEILLENESKIRGFSAEKPDSIRGENLSFCWFDELAVIRYFAFYHEGLMPALRKGEKPRMLITTTPKRIRLLRDLLADAENEAETGVHVTRGSSAENPHFARRQREALERKYAGTYMLKQELEGELVGEMDGCLFPLEQFNETRVFPGKDNLPQWRRVVIGYDPATTSRDSSDESGIVVMAEGDDGDYYCLEDCSGRYSPDQAMQVVAAAFYRTEADCVIAEVNVAGDFIRSLLNTVDANIPLRTVSGMRGKVARAQGASSLFAQGRIHMVGDNFRLLEDQLSAMTENDDRSRMHDDRADACLAEGTPVLTPAGEVPIEAIAPGDLVWTRAGWKPVTAARCTQRNAEVLTVLLSDGQELTGTGDHHIWTENDGWKRLDSLVWGDILSGWKNPLFRSYSRVAPTIATRTVRAAVTGSTTSTTQPPESGTCIAISGLPRTRAKRSRKAGIFTIRTRTRSITIRLISSLCRQPSTTKSTRVTSPGKRRISSITWTASGRWLRSGTVLKKAGRGTSSMASAPGRTASRFPLALARSAVPSSSRCGPTRSGARSAASTAPATRTRSTWRLSPVRSAALSSSATSTARSGPRRAPVSVVHSFASSERRDVYDLTVADVHEFTASGVIVHNCIWTIIHLAGGSQGDWAAVYGFTNCNRCGARVNEDKDTVCPNGHPVVKTPPKHAGGRPAREPWSAAYLNTCPKCEKKYSPGERSCPHCSITPETYLARALAAQQGGGGWKTYTGRDWLAGRRF